MAEVKPYTISKQVVWEAYLKVKANKGAAGVDGQEPFQNNLSNFANGIRWLYGRHDRCRCSGKIPVPRSSHG